MHRQLGMLSGQINGTEYIKLPGEIACRCRTKNEPRDTERCYTRETHTTNSLRHKMKCVCIARQEFVVV